MKGRRFTLWGPFVDRLVGFVGQEGPLMAALFDRTEESRENKPCEGKGQNKVATTSILANLEFRFVKSIPIFT